MKQMVTIYDIAHEAGVSPATVSRVITGNAGVSLEKSRRVRKVIEQYNFQPNALARSLLTKESKTIGVILPDIVNPFFGEIFLEVEACAINTGYSVILCNSVNTSLHTDKDAESMYLNVLAEKQVDGIMFLGGRANAVKTDRKLADEMNAILSRVPMVMINGRMRGVDCHRVRSDEREGIFQLVEYLHSLGHKKTGFIGGIPGITSTEIRHKAMKEALQYFNMDYNNKWVCFSDFSIKSGYDAMNALLSGTEKQERPTAIIAVNDFAAIGAMKYAAANGIRIPEDISITGFDDSYLCDIVTPGLTSVSHNIKELARIAIDMLCAAMSGKSAARESVVKPGLVLRESCQKLGGK